MRQPAGRQFAAFEIAVGAGVETVEQRPVHALEIERVGQRLAYLAVLELRPPRVEHEALHRLAGIGLEDLLLHVAGVEGREIVAGGPALRSVLAAEILEAAFREGLPCGIVVLEVDIALAVEIVAADIHRQVGAPIVLDPLPDDLGSRLEALDAVRSRSHRRFERRLGDVALLAGLVLAFPPVLGKHHKVADDVRQFAVAGLVEREHHLMIGDLCRLGHVGEVAIVDLAVLLHHVEGPDHVFGGDRLPVVPAGLGIDAVGRRRIVVGIFEGVRDEAVAGARAVRRLLHQRVVEDAAEPRQTGRRGAAHDERVEAVEGADRYRVECSALRSVRIDVVVALEGLRLDIRVDQRGRCPPFLGACGHHGHRDAGRDTGNGDWSS